MGWDEAEQHVSEEPNRGAWGSATDQDSQHWQMRLNIARGLRYIPIDSEQERLQGEWLRAGKMIRFSLIRSLRSPSDSKRHLAVTHVRLPGGEGFQLRALHRPAAGGHVRLPPFFYEAVHYGITASNPGMEQVGYCTANARLTTAQGVN
jgi:hypothetical protein